MAKGILADEHKKREALNKAVEDFSEDLEFCFPEAVRQEKRPIKVNNCG